MFRVGLILCHLYDGSCDYTESDLILRSYVFIFVGPCHHGMARPQVADGGTASDMEGICE